VSLTGHHYLRVRARDVLMRWTEATDKYFWVDVSSPDGPVVEEYNNQSWSNTQPHFRIFRPDDEGCAGTNHYELYRSWVDNSFTYTTTADYWDYEPDNVSTSGEHYLQAWARDSVGNWGPSTLTWFYYDGIPPASSHTLDPASPDGDNGWYVSPVQVTLTASDAHSGVDYIRYQLDGGSWATYGSPFTVSSDGSHTVQYYAVDVAGNEEDAHAAAFQVDRTPPSVSLSAPETFWPSCTVSWSASDATSGLRPSPYTVQYRVGDGNWADWLVNTPLTSAAFGPHDPVEVEAGQTYRFRAFAVDQAGNVGQSDTVASSTGPAPTMEREVVNGDKFLWWAFHLPLSPDDVPYVDRCPRIQGRCYYDHIEGPDEPADDETVIITLHAPGGNDLVYTVITDEDGEFELNAEIAGCLSFGTTQLGVWTATVYWEPEEGEGVPVVETGGNLEWEVEWYVGHVSD